ncbi:hypothetical protein [Streptomyces sp. NPDC053431]|uniref:nSTAND1 domain-containing NTPase n=1 Tax=Streptomyces sp. NPDC053431 TaxID=3365703 RepID=UPI0037CD80FC
MDRAYGLVRTLGLSPQQIDDFVREALYNHFGPKSLGRSVANGTDEDLFVGRERAVSTLSDWLAGDGPGLAVVTGQAGGGKSAVLGRVIRQWSASSSEQPLTVVWARGATAGDITRMLAHACGLSLGAPDGPSAAPTFGELLAGVAAHTRDGRILRVVVDALDEAGLRHEARHVPEQALAVRREARAIADLLRDLAKEPGVRIVVATRRGLLDSLATRDVLVDLDCPAYAVTPEETASYVERILRQGAAYRHDAGALREVVEAITELAHTVDGPAGGSPGGAANFLFARTAAHARTNDARPLTRYADWRERLPLSGGEAFVADITARLGERDAKVLLSLAYAEGTGLPVDETWQAVARALTGRAVSMADVRRVRSMSGDYLLLSTATGRETVQLFHQSLVDHVCAGVLGDFAENQRRIVDALTPAGARRKGGRRSAREGAGDAVSAWAQVSSYTRHHLPAHAAQCGHGRLERLFQDPGFLLACDPLALLTTGRTLESGPGSAALDAYRLSLHSWAAPDDERLRRLHANSRRSGADALAGAVERALPDDRRWTVAKALWAGDEQRSMLHSGQVRDIAVGHARQGPVIASAGQWGSVHIWDPLRGREVRSVPATTRTVADVELATLGDRETVVVRDTEGTVIVCDLETGEEIARTAAPVDSRDEVKAMTVVRVSGRTVLALTTDGKKIKLWDPTGHEAPRPLRRGRFTPARASNPYVLTGGTLAGADVLVAADVLQGPRLWDPGTGELLRTLRGSEGTLFALAATRNGPRDLVAARNSKGTVYVWDASSGDLLADIPDSTATYLVQALWVGRLDGVDVVVMGGRDGLVRVLGIDDGIELRRFRARASLVTCVLVTELEGRPHVIAGDAEGAVLVWDAEHRTAADPVLDSPPLGRPLGAFLGPVGGNGRAALFADRGTLRTWDLASRTDVIASQGKISRQIESVTLGTFSGRTWAVIGCSDGLVQFWDPSTGDVSSLNGLGTRVLSMAAGDLWGAESLVMGGADGSVSLWAPCEPDRAVLPPLRYLSPPDGSPVRHVTIGAPTGEQRVFSVAGDRTLGIWEPDGGGRTMELTPSSASGEPDVRWLLGPLVPAVSSDREVLVCGMSHWVSVVGLPGLDLLHSSVAGYAQAMVLTACSVGGRLVVAYGGERGALHVWLPEEDHHERLIGHTSDVTALDLRHEGGRLSLLSAAADRTLLLWRGRL